MSKFRAGVLAVAVVFAFAALAGCKSVDQDVSTFARSYTPKGLAKQVLSDLSSQSEESSEESSSEESSSEESSSSAPEPVVIPPAPEQPIQENVNVAEDPTFRCV